MGHVLTLVVCAWFASGLGLACALPSSILIDQWRLRHGKDTLRGHAYTLTGLTWWILWTVILLALVR
ncbi:hypothetical protein PG1770B_1657 [Bifidobacterium pseudolongum subsp. globosum]|uniref:Uncharacterized protein n=1 Tax=Bifidobacterium pseudolongum subsp. globosum TaxID=1690 RepID=A0A2N3QNC2_9BIFI|nr:hypothetical protein CQR45_1700 [Bifidobacterium pseudolongum subsp. globosum]PKU98857.1 hypothetical protein CQR54_1749 [Bifidobacterium pseudolongum subsp. globosum]RYQ46674.1 hypothetical protein PG1770B_1657 [Bifidobacterium pseudolongum subsp. globosum]